MTYPFEKAKTLMSIQPYTAIYANMFTCLLKIAWYHGPFELYRGAFLSSIHNTLSAIVVLVRTRQFAQWIHGIIWSTEAAFFMGAALAQMMVCVAMFVQRYYCQLYRIKLNGNVILFVLHSIL